VSDPRSNQAFPSTGTGSPLAGMVHRALGWCFFRLGANEGARRRYETVLRLRGADFGAHVRLAQIAYRLGDYASWQRECAQARRIDPLRYAQLGHPFELHDGRDLDGRTPRADRAADSGRPTAGRAASAEAGQGADPAGRLTGVVGIGGDDCESAEERDRFQSLGPIRPEQIAGVDLDDLIQRFDG
jgi:hypothetical protein